MSPGNQVRAKVEIMDGEKPDFGRTADDYAKHRQGFPKEFFDRLSAAGLLAPNLKVLDIGTGTGTIARGVAEYGCDVYACDPAVEILEKAKDLSLQQGVSIKFSVGLAEITNYPDNSFDLVLVGQAWHWFDYEKAIQEILRILKPDGKLVIAHFDWLPHKSSVADLSETLVTKHNPRWKGANGTGFYPEWTMQLAEAGFTGIESWSFDKTLHYRKESWLGRIRASAGISGSLSPEEILLFDREHSLLLDEKIEGDELLILHRCFTIVATPPKNG